MVRIVYSHEQAVEKVDIRLHNFFLLKKRSILQWFDKFTISTILFPV